MTRFWSRRDVLSTSLNTLTASFLVDFPIDVRAKDGGMVEEATGDKGDRARGVEGTISSFIGRIFAWPRACVQSVYILNSRTTRTDVFVRSEASVISQAPTTLPAVTRAILCWHSLMICLFRATCGLY